MTFLEQLKAHIGGLVRLKTQIYWYQLSAWDGVEGRVCLLLDAFDGEVHPIHEDGGIWHVGDKVLLLIDGSPKLLRLPERAVELIK